MRKAFATSALAVTASSMVAGPVLALPSSDWIAALMIGALATTFSIIGYLVTTRQEENIIGPLLLAVGTLIGVWIAAGGFTEHVYDQGNTLPGGAVALWLTMWTSIVGFGVMLIVFLRFPAGKLLSRRWRFVEWAAMVGLPLGATATALRPGPTDYVPSVDNPLGVESVSEIAAFAQGTGESIVSFVGLAAIASLVLRFWRSTGVERQQLKWFVFAVAFFPIVFSVAQLIKGFDPTEEDMLVFLTIMLGGFLIPVSMGIAILRYRLYDIDVIINRALVYVVLTLGLATLYLAFVLGFRAILSPVTGDSDIAVAASTLLVAALFRPFRTRLQSFIDRRFYRHKYDAAKTVGLFSSRLRDETDLASLSDELVRTTRSTVQPAHASLWLPSKGAAE